MADDRKIDLRYDCAECQKEVHVTSEKKLFDIVDTQSCAENCKLLCDECND